MAKNTVVAKYGKPFHFAASEPGAVVMRQQGRDRFSVTYGRGEKTHLNYREAAYEFGASVMHFEALNDGKLDNRMPGERS